MISSSEPWIDVGAIERDLNALWREASEAEEHGVIRSCILNLLVYTSGTSESQELDDALTDITASHPSRAILIVEDPDADESRLEAQVTSRCTLPTGTRKQVCCEQVTITA
ncbi:MAG TPA: glucose-6-phosphate dehydrogenase assembly protein OpcA, partial [Blastocatellia bacterium]|nr:glucose-6-phosphate dehydrogenase assembly protein OpcA [Blastocatellia bacterium]